MDSSKKRTKMKNQNLNNHKRGQLKNKKSERGQEQNTSPLNIQLINLKNANKMLINEKKKLNKESMKITKLDGGQVSGIVITVINVFLALLGVLAVALIIYAGFSYMFSNGDPEKMKKAQGVIVTSVIGLVIIISSYAISNYVFIALNQATGGDEASTNRNTGAQISPECADVGGKACVPLGGDLGGYNVKSCEDARIHIYNPQGLYLDETWDDLENKCTSTYEGPNNLTGTCFCSQGKCCGVK